MKRLIIYGGLALSVACAWLAAAPPPKADLSKPVSDISTNAPLPAAKDVLARFVKNLGGENVFSKIQSQHLTGKCEMRAQGITGDLEVFAKRPDKLVMKIRLPGVGEIVHGFDGKVGWSTNPMTGPMVLDGKMLDQMRDEARFDSVLHHPGEYKSMETLAKTVFEGKDCYKLKLVRTSGQEATEYYEVDSGLLVGSSEVQETPVGAVSVTAVIGDYKKFGDALFATRLTQKLGPLAQVMSFDKMEFNNVPDSAFDLPPDIKALVKK